MIKIYVGSAEKDNVVKCAVIGYVEKDDQFSELICMQLKEYSGVSVDEAMLKLTVELFEHFGQPISFYKKHPPVLYVDNKYVISVGCLIPTLIDDTQLTDLDMSDSDRAAIRKLIKLGHKGYHLNTKLLPDKNNKHYLNAQKLAAGDASLADMVTLYQNAQA